MSYEKPEEVYLEEAVRRVQNGILKVIPNCTEEAVVEYIAKNAGNVKGLSRVHYSWVKVYLTYIAPREISHVRKVFGDVVIHSNAMNDSWLKEAGIVDKKGILLDEADLSKMDPRAKCFLIWLRNSETCHASLCDFGVFGWAWTKDEKIDRKSDFNICKFNDVPFLKPTKREVLAYALGKNPYNVPDLLLWSNKEAMESLIKKAQRRS